VPPPAGFTGAFHIGVSGSEATWTFPISVLQISLGQPRIFPHGWGNHQPKQLICHSHDDLSESQINYLPVRLAEWVPPVGGALSRYISTWEVHATRAHRRGRVVPRCKQPTQRRGLRENPIFRAFQTPEILCPWEILYTSSRVPGLPRPSNLRH
jgi:hypothetical protein